jgi:hypothetical protein
MEQGIPVRASVHNLDARSDDLRKQGAAVVECEAWRREHDITHPAKSSVSVHERTTFATSRGQWLES